MHVAIDMAMNEKRWMRKYIFCLSILSLLMIGTGLICFSQEPKTETEIRTLLKNSRDKDFKVSDKANEELSKIDAKSIPTLMRILRKGKPCERVGAAGLIVNLDRNNKEVVPILTELATGGSLLSLFNLEEEMMCRRGAAFLLGLSVDGIRVLIRLLKEGDLFERQSAIFAFDELTETANYPEGSLQAMKEAIPVISKATKEKDETLSCMADEVLRQIVRGGDKELRNIAKAEMEKNK